jgi:hypothetical protein
MNKFALFILFTIIVLISSLERFRVIQDFPSYEVSNKGRIRHVKHRRILKTGLSNTGYRLLSIRVDGKAFTLNTHRLVAKEWCPNPEDKPCVDHIDGNRLNNRAVNLRWATHSENLWNQSKHKASTSKYKGVSKHGDKWLVHIRSQHIGIFKDEKEAAIAYNNHAKEHFGVFAKLNQMD